MFGYQSLTQEQQNLSSQLKSAISNRNSISDILEKASKNDLLKVLTTANIILLPYGQV